MPDFGWVEWARQLTPEQSESWKQIADRFRETLPPGHEGERLETSLEAAWREMTETVVKAPQPVREAVYAVLDLETGGVDPAKCAICSVAVMTLDSDLHEVDRYHRLVADDPSREYGQEAMYVNGLTRMRCQKEGTNVSDVMIDLHKILNNIIVVGHNVSFDIRFLKARGLAISRSVCTQKLARKSMKRPHDLQSVADRLAAEKGKAHDAMGDVITTANVFRKMVALIGKIEPEGIQT